MIWNESIHVPLIGVEHLITVEQQGVRANLIERFVDIVILGETWSVYIEPIIQNGGCDHE